MVEGASAAPLAQPPRAPSTAQTRVQSPAPASFHYAGAESEIVPATRMRRSYASSLREANGLARSGRPMTGRDEAIQRGNERSLR